MADIVMAELRGVEMVFAVDYRTAVSAIVELRLCQGVRADYAAEYGFESVVEA
jgi:hypothetical protein